MAVHINSPTNSKEEAETEGDLDGYVAIKKHFKSDRCIQTSLFTPETRSENIQQLYDAAAKTPVTAIEEMDRLAGEKERRSSDIFLCTPVLGQVRKKIKANVNIEIETRIPSYVEELRKWTSTEAIGDITVTPDCISRIGYNNSQNNSTIPNNLSLLQANNSGGSNGQDVIDCTTISNQLSRTNHLNEDTILDHRLPTPEEQCQIIALKFPAEMVRVDTSGKRFDRMSIARKSLLHVPISIGEHNNLDDNVQTVKRRSRSRKPRGKRRNTIAGTDQKEIEEAINGDADAINGTTTLESEDNKTIVVRSKSSDLHKKSSPASSNDTSRNSIARLSHFSSLKQWGKNRLRLINRNSSTDDKKDNNKEKVSDIDDFNVYETVISKNKKKFLEKERKLSHERKPSYSSSEKSLTITSQSTQNGIGSGGPSASINPVKMRESTSIRRQRRIGLGNKDEINSSSGNWSASSESGRTSIGSEITTQPKSSASSSSLNHSHHHPGSGPPSSIISRRRFLNTSASSSVTSEGTVTPDLQVHDFYDDETSSAYSCDTEGYYTSFHVDSGLKTLKEEEPATPLHISSALSSTNSFGSTSNQTVISAEAEYELFGKGSTSTTASSAGTVCTTLRASDSNRSLGPSVPERKSSLTRLHRSNSNVSNGTLERSYSSSTVGSSLERTGTIKRNGVLLSKEISVIVHSDTKYGTNGAESGDSGHNTSSSPIESNSSPVQGGPSTSEFEYSESSDLEGVERIERIRTKTKINSSRIPSLCVITPSNSDDETVITTNPAYRDKMPLPTDIETNRADNLMETDLDKISFKEMDLNSSRTCSVINELKEMKKEIQHVKKTTLLPLNSVFGKLRGVLPNLRKSPFKDTTDTEEPIYDGAGEYVTIADVTNNNQKINNYTTGVYYSNDIVKRNLATVLSGNLNEETEYISLNELPCNIRCDNSTRNNNILAPVGEEEIDSVGKKNVGTSQVGTSADEYTSKGARVTLDAHGKIVYSSDSLKRRKGAHTTFAPGPCVKQPPAETESVSSSSAPNSLPLHRQPTQIRPVVSQKKLNPVGNGAVETRPVNQVQSKPTISGRLSSESSEKSSASLKTGEMSIYGNRFSGNGVYETIKDNRFINGNRESFSADAQRLYHDIEEFVHTDVKSPPSSLPHYDEQNLSPTNPFSRSNNAYWTLQAKKQSINNYGMNLVKDDGSLIRNNRPLEELYSTPNKPKKQDLKTTPLGFSTFFSPVNGNKTPLNDVNHYKTSDLPKESPIEPRNNFGFHTSTPSKLTTDLNIGILPTQTTLADDLKSRLRIQESQSRSATSSPVTSGRSTPLRGIVEQQTPRMRNSWAPDTNNPPSSCSDRLGTPKTSLMDFKKLLLAKAGKSLTTPKQSAVELLKANRNESNSPVKKEPMNSSMKILDLSGSPKTFATRRMIRQGNFGSPSRVIVSNPKLMSPRSGWRVNNKTDVITTAIPEANSEEDNSSANGSSNSSHSSLDKSMVKTSPIKQGVNGDGGKNLKNNIFLQAEENNFMKGELIGKKTAMSRTQLIQARNQFLGNDMNSMEKPISVFSAQFGSKQFESKLNTENGDTLAGTTAPTETAL